MTSENIQEQIDNLRKYEMENIIPRKSFLYSLKLVETYHCLFHTIKGEKCTDKVREAIMWLEQDLKDIEQGMEQVKSVLETKL